MLMLCARPFRSFRFDRFGTADRKVRLLYGILTYTVFRKLEHILACRRAAASLIAKRQTGSRRAWLSC